MCFLRLDSFRLKATAVNFETNGRDARATIFCRHDELSYEKIAKILDCSLSAAKSLIHRGAGDAQGEVETVFEERELGGLISGTGVPPVCFFQLDTSSLEATAEF